MKIVMLIMLNLTVILNVLGQVITDKPYTRCLTMEALANQLKNNEHYKSYHNSVYNNKSYKNIQFAPLQPVVVPVAFHFSADVINCTEESCLIDEVEDQLQYLNEAFADNSGSLLINDCPAAYQTVNGSSVVSTGTNISFCYATPPDGNAQGLDQYCDLPITIGAFSGGTFVNDVGAPGWDNILNIFIADGNFLGAADGIPGSAIADGVTISAAAFGGVDGSTCNLGVAPRFNLGRTVVHEIGHYLGLFHTFQGKCNDEPNSAGPYNVDDTPPLSVDTSGCPNGCIFSCDGQETATANFMDYTDDACMGVFSVDQALVMNFWANILFGDAQYNCGNQALTSLNTICNNTCNINCPSAVNTRINMVEQYCGAISNLSFPNPKANGLSLNVNNNGEIFKWSVNNYLSEGGTAVDTPSNLSTTPCEVTIATYFLNIDCYTNPLSTTLNGGIYEIQIYPSPPNDLSTLIEVTNENNCNEPILSPIMGCESNITIVAANSNPAFPVGPNQTGATNYTINYTANPNGPDCCNPPTLDREILENGDFELEAFRWKETEEAPPGTPNTQPYGIIGTSFNTTLNMNGTSDAWLGGYGQNALTAIEQSIKIPLTNTLLLAFDYKTARCVNVDDIELTVYINNTAVVTLNCGDATNSQVVKFGPSDIPIAAFNTGNAFIRFEVLEMGTNGGSLLIDNVSLKTKDNTTPVFCNQQISANYNCQNCVSILTLNDVENNDVVYKAQTKITSTSTVNAHVIYQAGQCIRLDNGFSINQNNNFGASIEACD